jgi:hypothetical protein
MTLGIPSGGMGTDRFGVQVGLIQTSSGEPEPKHRTFGGRVFAQLARTKDNYNDYGFKADLSIWLAKESSTSTDFAMYINDDESIFSAVIPTADKNQWVPFLSDNHVNTKVIADFQDNQKPMPKKLKGAFAFNDSTSEVEASIHAVYAIAIDFGVDNPETLEVLEENGRYDPAVTTIYDWSPQDENESCSAWVMKQQALSNTNRILQETVGFFSIPLFDSQVPFT